MIRAVLKRGNSGIDGGLGKRTVISGELVGNSWGSLKKNLKVGRMQLGDGSVQKLGMW